jgi:hypothetical protein
MEADFTRAMTAFDEALGVGEQLEAHKWKLGDLLRQAVDDEERTIRDFALARDGNVEREDTYSNYVKAERFRLCVEHFEEYPLLASCLGISYFYLAWEMWTHRDYPVDFELVMEWLTDAIYRENGQVRTRGTRGLRNRWYEATGREKTFTQFVASLQKLWARMKPVVIGRKDALNASDAAKAAKLAKLMDEVEELLDD